MRSVLLFAASLLALVGGASAEQRRPAPAAPASFTTPLSVAEMSHKQAVVETSRGTFVIELLPEVAPNHVGYFMKLAREGAYNGTTVHRAIAMGIIQGGDPLSKDPSKRDLYGTGGLGVLKAEFNATPVARGAVAAVLQPGKPNSGGAQFFIAVTDQLALNGQFTVFGRVVDGMEVVQQISQAPVDAQGRVSDRIEITRVTIRDTPPSEAVPFASATVDEMAAYRAVLETSKGEITIRFRPDKAPEHVRNFLRLAQVGAYDGTTFHRVVRGFVIQTGMMSTRTPPLTQRQQAFVHNLQPEFNDIVHVAGTVSMARLDDPASASTSFFICTAPAPSLDGKYTAFGEVVAGMDVVQAIEAVPVNGDAPTEKIELRRVRLEKP
jgi:cyclophilin family peptidyl-prolyl cis-trans isomerase